MKKVVLVRWTENAIRNLEAIKEFISHDSSKRAGQWVNELFSAGEDLATFTRRGRIVPEFNKENLRELIIENYRLVYRVKTNQIEILTVFEGHRQLRKRDIRK